MDREVIEVTESVFDLDCNGDFEVTPEVYDSYWKHGYILIRGLLNEEEVKLIDDGWMFDPYLQEQIYKQSDDKGDLMDLAVWDDASNDASGLVSRSQKLAGTIEKLVGDEVYHYHAKYLQKRPRTGGSFIWHQDYGYWYYFGNLFPDDMCTAFLAVDDINLDNGCLKIIPKSHHCGRVDHIKYDEQIQADLVRVEQYKERLGVKDVVMKKGDALIFHSNVLHRSDKNDSDRRRLVLGVAYNTRRNNPTKVHHHPCYKPMEKDVVMKKGDALIFHSNVLHRSDKNDSDRRRLVLAVAYNTTRDNPTKVHHHPRYKPMGKVDNSALLEWGKHKTWDSTKVFYNPNTSKNHMKFIESRKETK